MGLAAALVLGLGAAPFPAARLAPGDLEGHQLLDRHGRLLRERLGPAGRATWRDLDQISPWAARALVAVEDHRFAQHRGKGGAGSKYLKGRTPLTLVFQKNLGGKSLALKVERKVKKLSKARKEELIRADSPIDEIVKQVGS